MLIDKKNWLEKHKKEAEIVQKFLDLYQKS